MAPNETDVIREVDPAEEREVLLQHVYHHFKGNSIFTLAIVTHTETSEKMVLYEHMETHELFVRPYDMFLSEVDHEKYPDVKQKYRFEPVIPANLKEIHYHQL